MNQYSFVFELTNAGVLAACGSWLYIEAYAGPGLLIVSGILFGLTLGFRVKQVQLVLFPNGQRIAESIQ